MKKNLTNQSNLNTSLMTLLKENKIFRKGQSKLISELNGRLTLMFQMEAIKTSPTYGFTPGGYCRGKFNSYSI